MCVLLYFLLIQSASLASATVQLTDYLRQFTRNDNDNFTDDVIQLPNAKVACLTFEVMSSQLLLNGQNDTSIILEPPRSDEQISPIHQQINRHPIQSRLFAVRNATFSISQVRMELDETATNSDVLFASVCSSVVCASHIEFIRSGWGPLMTLERLEEFSNVDSSITLIKCAIQSKSGRMEAILCNCRGSEGPERIFMSILNSNVENQQIVGQDGIGVGEGPDGSRFLRHSGVTTSLIAILFHNVSSLPGSVASASSSFRQQMIGSSVWGSNNHLSGSTLRDMNSGGSVLCSNTTFIWCSTTSEERTSSSQLRPSSLSSNENIITDRTYDGNTGDDSDIRLNITTDTTFINCIFQNLNYTTEELDDGGSALILSANTTYLTVDNCTFSNCSVAQKQSKRSVTGGCILLKGSTRHSISSTFSVSSCSFADWYPRNSKSTEQRGGGIGTFYTCAPLSILGSNFTLSGVNSIQPNGGFISIQFLEDTSSPVTISNCRLQGDGTASDSCLYLRACYFGSDGLTISDTEIVNTNSFSSISAISGIQPVVVTRSNLVCGILQFDFSVDTTHDPLLIVDCTLDGFKIDSIKSNPNFFFVGTTFLTSNPTYSVELLSFRGPCFLIVQSCLFESCETSRDGLISCSKSISLTLDTCTMKECKTIGSSSSLFDLSDTAFKAYSCTFVTITGKSSSLFYISSNGSILVEDCRFNLEPSNRADFRFNKASPSLLNTSSVVGCTSNRTIRVTTDGNTFTESPLFKVIPTLNPKTEIELKADSDEDGKPIETMNKLSPAIQQLGTDSPTVLSLSDGWYSETSPLHIQTAVEIVGNGTENVHHTLNESPRPHTTKLKAMLNVKAGANLTLRSMTLLPTSPSPLVTMSVEGNLTVRTVVVSAEQDRTKELFSLSAGSTRLSHSRFSSIAGSSALIVVSGNGSLTLSDTLFLFISRTLTIDVNGSVQSGSCVEGQTSGSISIRFCKFGVCSSNGRAGVIDIVSNGSTSRVEMEGCQFDQNLAGAEMDETGKGDDVVLKDFSDEQLTLNFTTIESFPSIMSFLINECHPHVPPPHTLHFTQKGFDIPLAWSSPYKLCEDRLSNLTLQFLLGSRLHNNVHTAIIMNFAYNETMTPFSLSNASISLLLSGSLTITQPNKQIFGHLLNASLSMTYPNLSFSELTNTVFFLDHDSSLSLTYISLVFTKKPLTHSFVTSTGRSIVFYDVKIPTGLILDSVSFVRHVRSTNDGTFTWTGTPVSSVNLTTQPFLHLEGMSTLNIEQDSYSKITNISSSCDGSFLFAKKSNVTLSKLKVSLCKALRGGFAFCHLCNLTIMESEFSSCSAQHGGVIFVELDAVNQLSSFRQSLPLSLFTDCKATTTDENGMAAGKGGAICVKGTTTAELPINLAYCLFEKNTAAFGNDVFVEKSVLGDKGSDRLKRCGGESRSGWPHLEVEGITKEENESEWTRISTFIDFPTIRVRNLGTDD
ncbi:hypothetical protein BLNAU_11872 [Blattamonas nauphoetae]|uniref:Uncharacterized protein n=1 Tax=Blattamonas nauphoetae TaxID=2049346 RepID=A0ABQ9XRX3_9EUKA|nr:hypothetical protein BLNAU_11872 [Blattamonas nauphoetae]